MADELSPTKSARRKSAKPRPARTTLTGSIVSGDWVDELRQRIAREIDAGEISRSEFARQVAQSQGVKVDRRSIRRFSEGEADIQSELFAALARHLGYRLIGPRSRESRTVEE